MLLLSWQSPAVDFSPLMKIHQSRCVGPPLLFTHRRRVVAPAHSGSTWHYFSVRSAGVWGGPGALCKPYANTCGPATVGIVLPILCCLRQLLGGFDRPAWFPVVFAELEQVLRGSCTAEAFLSQTLQCPFRPSLAYDCFCILSPSHPEALLKKLILRSGKD